MTAYGPGATTDPATPSPVHPNAGHTLRGGHWAFPGEAVPVSKRFFGSDEGAPVGGFRCTLP